EARKHTAALTNNSQPFGRHAITTTDAHTPPIASMTSRVSDAPRARSARKPHSVISGGDGVADVWSMSTSGTSYAGTRGPAAQQPPVRSYETLTSSVPSLASAGAGV